MSDRQQVAKQYPNPKTATLHDFTYRTAKGKQQGEDEIEGVRLKTDVYGNEALQELERDHCSVTIWSVVSREERGGAILPPGLRISLKGGPRRLRHRELAAG